MAGVKPTVIVDDFSAIDAAMTVDHQRHVGEAISEWKLDGIAYGAYHNMSNVESTLAAGLNPSGMGMDLNGNVSGFMSITRQAFKDYLINSGKMAIDAGTQNIFLDTATLGLDSFDAEVLAGFRTYLATNFSAAQLAAMGVADSVTFDYRQHLVNAGFADSATVVGNPPNDALWIAWKQYHVSIVRDWFTLWTTTLRNYAQSLGQTVSFSVNRAVWGGNDQWDVADLMDLTMAETFLDSLRYPFRSLSFAYKTSLSLGKRFWSWNFPNNTPGWINVNTLQQLFTAETFANGGLSQVPMGWVDFLHQGGRVDYLSPFYHFATGHPELYNLSEDGEIAVLYSQSGEDVDPGAMGGAFRGGVALLEADHRPYDVVFAGPASPLTLAKLIPYKAVYLPNTRILSNAEVAVLESYLAQGGILIGSGIIADQDENGHFITRSLTALFQMSGVQHPASGGTIISFPASPSNPDMSQQVNSAADGTAAGKAAIALLLTQFDTLVDPVVSRDISTALPAESHISRFVDASDNSDIYHIVNHNYNFSTDTVTATGNVQMSARIPAGFTAQTLIVSYMTPSAPNPQVLNATVSGNQATFTLPTLNIWGIVKVGSAASNAQTLDDKPQSNLITVDAISTGSRPDALDKNGNIINFNQYWHGPTLAGQPVSFDIPFLATDDQGLARVDLYSRLSTDGVNWGAWTLDSSYTASGTEANSVFTVQPASDGYYQYRTVAVDTSGQREVVLPRDESGYAVDSVSPQAVSSVTEANGVQDGVAQTSVTSPSFSWSVPSDNVAGVRWYNIELRDASTFNLVASSYNQDVATATWAPGTLSPGTYDLTIRAQDWAGNWSSNVTAFTFVLASANQDTTPPVVTPPANIMVTASSASGASATDTAIAAFLNGATATDNVDGVITGITNDAPIIFPAGSATMVTFSATDVAGNTGVASATVTVNPLNHAPIATSAAIVTNEDTTSAGVTPSVNDPDVGDTHTFTIVTQPAHGSANIVANKLKYTPTLNYNGPDAFTFKATDAGGLLVNGTASITVNPVNDPPAPTAPAINTIQGSTATSQVSHHDPDAGDTQAYGIATAAVNGIAGVDTAGLAFYTPNTGFVGNDRFTVTVTDTAGFTGVVTINVTVTMPTISTVGLSLNGFAFNSTSNKSMMLTATTVASNPVTNADVYVALQLPDGTLLVMQPDGSFSMALTPLVANIPVPNFTGLILNYTFTGAEPIGNYTWFAVLAAPGTLNFIGTLAVVSFTFGP